MNKTLFFGLLLAVLAWVNPGRAADTSVSIISRGYVTPVGEFPQVGYVHADATAAAVSANRLTFDLPLRTGMKASDITGYLPTAQNVSGSIKPLNITRSGQTVTVTGSNMTSGTMAVSDTIRVMVIYRRP